MTPRPAPVGFAPAPRPVVEEPLQRYQLNAPPWADPLFCREAGVLPGATLGWRQGDRALLFHTTAAANAAEILRSGFRPSPALEVGGHPHYGIPGRMMPAGVWASIRPTLPLDSDTWLPDVCQQPWVVLVLRVPVLVLADRYVFEHTWPVAQFCLDPAEIQSVEELAPADLPRLLVPELLQTLSGWRQDYHGQSPYLDAIDAAAGPAAAAAVPLA